MCKMDLEVRRHGQRAHRVCIGTMLNCSRAHWLGLLYARYDHICDVIDDLPPEYTRLQLKAINVLFKLYYTVPFKL